MILRIASSLKFSTACTVTPKALATLSNKSLSISSLCSILETACWLIPNSLARVYCFIPLNSLMRLIFLPICLFGFVEVPMIYALVSKAQR
jgi:hypothetical protein